MLQPRDSRQVTFTDELSLLRTPSSLSLSHETACPSPRCQQRFQSRDDTSTALFRAQKLIHRLRKEKTSLLDRVMLLESAAGLSPPEILAAQEAAEAATSSQPFPLLHQPLLPSLKDRPRPQPVITTATDLSQSNYNDPLGPVPLPQSLPPRQRSHHLLSTIAADKLRESHEAKRVARGLLKAPYPAVAVLGLEGSYVAENVERAMAGERFGEAGASGEVGAGKSSGGGGGTKRRRESSVGGSSTVKAKARAPIETLQGLPNPFAGFGAVPVGAPEPTPPPPSVSASGRHASSQLDNDVDMPDGSQSPGSIMYSEDEDGGAGVDVKPKERRHRKMEGDKVIKPKRVKAHGITSGTFQIPRVPRYPDGTPQLPLPVGIMVLRNLGGELAGARLRARLRCEKWLLNVLLSYSHHASRTFPHGTIYLPDRFRKHEASPPAHCSRRLAKADTSALCLAGSIPP